jgi:hypothetical protein
MIKRIFLAAALALSVASVCCSASPALAQFYGQATDAGTGAGSSNAQTITVPNATSYSDLIGVLVKLIPGATNSGDMTLQVNGFATPPHVEKPIGSGMGLLTGQEFTSGQEVVVKLDASGFWFLVSPTSLPVGAAGLSSSALSYGPPPNLQLNATVGSNQLTVSVVGSNGSNASATNPIPILFRDTTISNGDPVLVSLQASQSFTIGSGNTMGCVSGVMCRLWEYEINNAGTPGLCLYNTLSGTTITDLNEANLQTSAATTNGGSSAQTLYCNTASVSSKAVRRIGYIDVVETVAGTWTSLPTYVQLFGPGIKKPGETVQNVNTSTTTQGFTTSATFVALTNGQTASITPTSAANVIRVFTQGTLSAEGANQPNLQISRTISASTTLIGNPTGADTGAASSAQWPLSILVYDVPNVTSSVTYGYQGKISSGSTLAYPVSSSGSVLELQEIMSSIEPANDNVATLAMAG